MFTFTFTIPRCLRLWITCRVMPMLRMKIFIAGSEFLCSSNSVTPRSAQREAISATPSMKRAHDSAYGVWNG